jgi:prevent-host-death family protein
MEISAAEFRTRCFTILDQVDKTHAEIIITKRGKPIARLTRIEDAKTRDPLLGALAGLGRTIRDLTKPVLDAKHWETD